MFSLAEKIIAARNLRPKKKEGFLKVISSFSFIGIMLGVAILIIVMSVMNGFRSELTNKILGFNPHVVIKSYTQELTNPESIKEISKDIKISQTRKSFSGEAVLMDNNSTKGVYVKGLDINDEQNLNFLNNIIIKGNTNSFGTGELILGNELALDFNLSVGDTINLFSSSFVNTPFGNLPKQETFKVKAIFNSGFYEFDKNVIFLELNESLIFFDKNEKNLDLEIFIDNPINANLLKDNIEKENPNLFVYSWIDLNKSFFSALKVERNVMFIILALIIIVAAFNIISGLTILIKNKTKEIAILKTLGLSNRSIIKSFFLTGFTIGFLATITGIFIGILFSLYIEPIRNILSLLFNVEIFPSDIYFLDKMPSEINTFSIITVFFLSIFMTAIASLIPALKISKMNIIRAIKYE
ncbi:MAG: lipoprotein-releasing ABC transporter permease subunit [Pelagibacteraceae bacterium]